MLGVYVACPTECYAVRDFSWRAEPMGRQFNCGRNKEPIASPVPSVEPLSTTMISTGG